MPAVHPYIASAPDDTAGHTVEFREASISPSGDAGLINAAKVMAMTAIDLLAGPELLQAVKAELATAVERR